MGALSSGPPQNYPPFAPDSTIPRSATLSTTSTTSTPSPGFVWRLKSDSGSPRSYLKADVYRTAQLDFFCRRTECFATAGILSFRATERLAHRVSDGSHLTQNSPFTAKWGYENLEVALRLLAVAGYSRTSLDAATAAIRTLQLADPPVFSKTSAAP